jgi:phosphoglycolate phosphatase-like HAD superfamily hydrolase
MQYIFDFDHTLFDTARFVYDARAYKENGTLITPAIWDTFDATTYLYDDVIPFLERVGKENVRILTAITPSLGAESEAFQRAKLERSGIGAYVRDIQFLVGEKGQTVASMYEEVSTTFVDNMLHQVQSVQVACPSVRCIQIMRPNPLGLNEMDGMHPTVTTITTLYEITN